MEDECLKLCFYSNFIFLINVIVAIYYKYYTYAAVFMFLTMSSLYHHSHYTNITRIVDKVAVYLVAFYGGYLFYSKLKNHTEPMSGKELILSFIIMSSFLSTILLYYYGYMTNSFCYFAKILSLPNIFMRLCIVLDPRVTFVLRYCN